MLRVGLTGELGSGKSTVARLLAERGARVLSSDEMARAMMQPGYEVYRKIVERFGPEVVREDGQLDRPALGRLAFAAEHPRVKELNAIVHPAVLAEQERVIAEMARAEAGGIAVVESALIFTTRHATTRHAGAGGWRERFDRVVMVTAPDALKVQRYVDRVTAGRVLAAEEREGLREEAWRRLAAQRVSTGQCEGCLVLRNEGSMEALVAEVEPIWAELRRAAGQGVGLRPR